MPIIKHHWTPALVWHRPLDNPVDERAFENSNIQSLKGALVNKESKNVPTINNEQYKIYWTWNKIFICYGNYFAGFNESNRINTIII